MTLACLPNLGLCKGRAWPASGIAVPVGETGHFWSLPAEHKLLFRPPGPPPQVLGYVVPPQVDLGVDPRKIQKHAPGLQGRARGQAVSLYALCLSSDACCVPQWSALCPVSQENVLCRVPPPPLSWFSHPRTILHGLQTRLMNRGLCQHIQIPSLPLPRACTRTCRHSQNTGKGLPESSCHRWLCPLLSLAGPTASSGSHSAMPLRPCL